MRKFLLGLSICAAVTLTFAFTQSTNSDNPAPAVEDAIVWLTWEEATAAMENEPKKMFIDVYTEWCGWCKRMDAQTFTDPDVISYMNENYYAVKFDAEGREDAEYKGQTLTFRADAGRRGVHELAYVLLNGRLGYPSFVYLDEEQNSLKVSPGYKTPEVLIQELETIASR